MRDLILFPPRVAEAREREIEGVREREREIVREGGRERETKKEVEVLHTDFFILRISSPRTEIPAAEPPGPPTSPPDLPR